MRNGVSACCNARRACAVRMRPWAPAEGVAGSKTADPLCKYGTPRVLSQLRAKENNPVSDTLNNSETLPPRFFYNGRFGRRSEIEVSPVSICPCDDGVVATQSDQSLSAHRSVIRGDAPGDFGPGSA